MIDDIKVANIFKKEFKEISQGSFGKRSVVHDEKPREVLVSGVRVKVNFAPDHAPEMEIMKQMLKAQSRIDFAMFTFSKSSGIDEVMIEKTSHGFPIQGVLDSRQANQKWAATRPVKNAGAELYTVSSTATLGKLHHKLMVLDEHVIIVGSFNYTGPANLLNDENIVVLGDREATKASEKKAQKKLADYARTEIDRIINSHGVLVQ